MAVVLCAVFLAIRLAVSCNEYNKKDPDLAEDAHVVVLGVMTECNHDCYDKKEQKISKYL